MTYHQLSIIGAGHNKEPFNCIAANPSSKLLAGGTDKIGEDASIYIW